MFDEIYPTSTGGSNASSLISSANTLANAVVQATEAKRQYKWNKKAAADANVMNRENQQWLLQQQKDIQREQRDYDSARSQMQRYIEAGLNPHLIYGSGSSAGQAFPMNAPGMPSVNIQSPNVYAGNPVRDFIAASQAQANVGLTDAKTGESLMRKQLTQVQEEIARTNPMLRPEVAASVADSMNQVAMLKADLAYFQNEVPDGAQQTRGRQKVIADLDSLYSRLKLNTSDLKIRNEILQSKEFMNDLARIQRDWMKNGDITPEHIRQAVMMVFSWMKP